MNAIFDKRSAERFAQLIDEADDGLRRHSHNRAEAQRAQLANLGDKLGGVRISGRRRTSAHRCGPS